MTKAVHFGAGNIGRGFVGLLLHEAGYELVFADVADALITQLQEADSYEVRTVGQNPTRTVVDGFSAINSTKDPEGLTEQIASADVVTTAVGAHILRFVAPNIAAGIAARPAGAPRLAVMACENAINATDLLEQEIRANYQGEDLDDKALFSNTAVDRIVPVQAEGAGLDVTVEDFYEWAVDRTPFAGQELDVPGITWVDDLGPYIERKLFTVNTGHATTAWHGWAAGPYDDRRRDLRCRGARPSHLGAHGDLRAAGRQARLLRGGHGLVPHEGAGPLREHRPAGPGRAGGARAPAQALPERADHQPGRRARRARAGISGPARLLLGGARLHPRG